MIFVFLVQTSLEVKYLFGVFLLHIFNDEMKLIAVSTLNLLFLCMYSIIFLFAHLVNHANPTLIIFLYLILELLHNFGMILFLLLHLDEKFGLLLSVILFQFMQLEGAIVEFYFQFLEFFGRLRVVVLFVVVTCCRQNLHFLIIIFIW